MAYPGKRLLQRADNQPAHQTGIGEAHLRLGWMNIDIDVAWLAVDEQRQRRMSVVREEVHIGGANGAAEQLVLHWPPIDINILPLGVAAMIGGQTSESAQARGAAFGCKLEGVGAKLLAKNLRNASRARRKKLGVERLTYADEPAHVYRVDGEEA